MARGERKWRGGVVYKHMPGSTAPDLTDDAAAVIPWVRDGFQAIEVYIDPGLRDRVAELDSLVDTWAATHTTLDGLSETARVWSQNEDVNASIYENLPDDPSVGTIAIAFTIG
jgi:hypothetical protein